MSTLKRRTTLLLVAALSAALLPLGAVPAFAYAGDRWNLSGSDPVSAAVAVSRHAFPRGAARAVIARADTFPDALASALLQRQGPLLLTDSGTLSTATAAELQRLQASEVTILGGEKAVSEAVATQLAQLGVAVTRLSGTTRVDTAVKIAATAPSPRTVLLARAFGGSDPTQGFADALAAGAWSAASGYPVLLSETDRLSDATAAYLRAHLPVTVIMVGGTAALSDTVKQQLLELGAGVRRSAGSDRAATATAIASAQGFSTSRDVSRVVLLDSRGEQAWAPGFAAASLATQQPTAVVLADGEALPTATRRFLAGGDAELVCTPLLAQARCDDAAQRLSLPGITVSPFSDQWAADAEVEAGKRREYRVEVKGGGPFTVALVAAGQAGRDAGQWVLDHDGDGLADGIGAGQDSEAEAIAARITRINGVAVPAEPVHHGVLPVSGRITFSADLGQAGVAARPVVFADVSGDHALQVDGTGAIQEPAAVGGATVWTGATAASGAYADQKVGQAWPALKLFTSGERTFRWRDADTFAYNSGLASVTTLTRAQFEAMLGAGDTVAATVADSSSRYTIVRDVPLAPAGVSAVAVDLDGDTVTDTVRVRWIRPSTIDLARENPYALHGSVAEDGGWADWTQVAQGASPSTASVDVPLAAGTHRLRLTSRNSAADVSAPSRPVVITVSAAGPATAPISTASTFTTGSGQSADNKVLDAGDQFTITFDGPVTVAANATLSLRDADGTHVRLTRGENAAFTLGGEKNDTLTVAVTAPPVRLDAVGDAACNMATLTVVVAATGISNSAGVWNLAASGRVDSKGGNRTVVGGNSKLPAALPASALSADAGHRTITVAAGATGIATNDPIDVYDRNGTRVGGRAYHATAGTTITLAAMSEGERYYLVYSDLDNVSLPSATATLVVPSTRPAVSKAGGHATSLVLTFNENVTLAGATGHLAVYDRDDRLQFSGVTALSGGNKHVIATLSTALVTGTTYHARIEAGLVKDSSGATNEARSVSFTAAAAAVPAVTISTGPTGGATVTSAASTWTGTTSDSGGVVTALEQRVDGGAWSALGFTVSLPSDNATWSLTLTLAEGSHTVDVRATDNNGGVSALATKTLLVNAAAPTLQSAVVSNATTLTVTFSEAVTCPSAGFGAWSFNDGGGAITATSVSQSSAPSTQCAVVFSGAAFNGATTGTLTHTQPANASQRVVDTASTAMATASTSF